MDWYQKFIVPLWKEYKLWGFILIGVLLLGAAYIFGVDLGGYINGLLGQ
jgi:hypothetical protein